MSDRPKVLVTPRSLTAGRLDTVPELEPLRRAGFDLVSPEPGRMPTREDLVGLVPGCVGWLAGVEHIDAGILERATQLRAISRNGTGTDAIDLGAAARHGVAILRAEGANAQGVAELVLTLVLAALRNLLPAATALRAGRWERAKGAELADLTVGVVGLGAIGGRTAAMFTALGAHVVGHDPYASELDLPLLDLDELVATADVITLSCPPPADGRPIVDARRLAMVRKGTVLVNTARSQLVDDDAVLAALTNGTLTAYAVDAFDTEPPEPSALLAHERVIATPHIGGFTGASVRRATTVAVDNLLDALVAQ